MQAIWKYPLQAIDTQTIELPKDAKVLCVQAQNDVPCLWVVNKDTASKETEDRVFTIYGTGHLQTLIHGNYIGTFQLLSGSLVYHVFEET